MLINAAPRMYTSNIVADADLNLEGYNVTANALYSKDNFLLTMLDYGEAFPTDVKEGDKLFAWGEDSTKSYIYTYKHGSWDAGVKPRHMQDYYIADENRTVKFYFLKSSFSSRLNVLSGNRNGNYDVYRNEGLLFGPDCYLMGSIGVRFIAFNSSSTVENFSLVFTKCDSFFEEVSVVDRGVVFSGSSSARNYDYTVVVPSAKTAFVYYLNLSSFSQNGGYFTVCGGYEVDN